MRKGQDDIFPRGKDCFELPEPFFGTTVKAVEW